jgi:PTH1 family peptidyl-tRNA hydrolase
VTPEWLVVGLGNPGPRYEGTRHNIGKRVARLVAERTELALDTSRFNTLFGIGSFGGTRFAVVLPLKYMNENGTAVAPLARFYRIPPSRVLAVFDDLDLPLGKVRIRGAGGAGGNRGALSLIRALGTEEFPRVRIGIGRPPEGWDAADYVLAPFAQSERAAAAEAADTAASAILHLLSHGLEAAMNLAN